MGNTDKREKLRLEYMKKARGEIMEAVSCSHCPVGLFNPDDPACVTLHGTFNTSDLYEIYLILSKYEVLYRNAQ